VLAIGFANVWRIERKVAQIHAACVKKGKAPDEFSKLGAELLCDPKELARSTDNDPPGVQGELARAQRQLFRWQEWPTRVGLLIALLCAIPWAWYFVLDRIREFREAIIGR
jgi:hypothetical protein